MTPNLLCDGDRLAQWLDAHNRLARWNHVRDRAGLRELSRVEAIVVLVRMRPSDLRDLKEYLE